MHGLRLCRDKGIKVGLRFTMTQDNAEELPQLLDLMKEERINKFYFSHLNYAGRGNKNREDDVFLNTTRWAMDLLFNWVLEEQRNGRETEFVTGNNDVIILVRADYVRERSEGTHIKPATVQLYGVHVLGFFHNGVVNADFG